MRASVSFLLFAALLASGPAVAGEAPAAAAPAPTLLMSPLAIPVVVDGRMANYVYLTLRLHLSPKADAAKLRDKEPFFRDALLHAAYRTPLQRADDNNSLDQTKVTAVMMRESAAIAGPGMVTGVQFIRAQPQRFLSKPSDPRPGPPKAG